MDLCQKKHEHLQPHDPSDIGDAWIWRALALPSHLRVVHHLSHDRSEKEATAFLAAFKARTDGRPPLFTSDKLPAYVEALIAHCRVCAHLGTGGDTCNVRCGLQCHRLALDLNDTALFHIYLSGVRFRRKAKARLPIILPEMGRVVIYSEVRQG